VVIGVGRVSGDPAAFGFIWDETHGVQSLHAVLSSSGADLSGFTCLVPQDLSDDGTTIIGWGCTPQGTRRWIAALSVPEPRALSLLVCGLGALAVRLRWPRTVSPADRVNTC
jgi:hypothetical protein